jgi:heat shock protein 5
VSVVAHEDGVSEIISTEHHNFGGRDFDEHVVEHFLKVWKRLKKIQIPIDSLAAEKIRFEVEKAKKALDTLSSASMFIPQIVPGQDFQELLSRRLYKKVNKEYLKKILSSVEKMIEEAKLKKKDITEIVLTGGAAKMPKIKSMLIEYFGRVIFSHLDPVDAIVRNAAYVAHVINGGGPQVQIMCSTVPISVGIETHGGLFKVCLSFQPIKRVPFSHSPMTVFPYPSFRQLLSEILQSQREKQ